MRLSLPIYRHHRRPCGLPKRRLIRSSEIILVLCIISSLSTTAQISSELGNIFAERDVIRYEEGVTIYLDLLEQASEPPLSDELHKHLQFLDLIISDGDPVRTSLNALRDEKGKPEHVTVLIQWWNQQDPLPATFTNERLIEHLSRVYYAINNYSYPRNELGFDARGEILIRLGWPDTQSEVTLKNNGLYLRPIENTLPRNEFWVYRRIHQDAHYFFVYQSRRRGYKMGTVEDLIPNKFRSRKEDALVLLTWLDEIYQQLAAEHQHYGPMFDAVSNYVSIASSDETQPFYFTKRILQDTRVRDNFHQRSRNENVPSSATEIGRSPMILNPCVRWARFLNPDGATSLNLSWGINPESLSPNRRVIRQLRKKGIEPSEDFLLTSFLITQDSAFAPSNLRLRQYHLNEGASSSFNNKTWVIKDVQDIPNLGVQWEYSWTYRDDQNQLLPSSRLGFHVYRLNSIRTLNGSGQTLEMSDILLTKVDTLGIVQENAPMVEANWNSENPLGIYFEIYFLQFNAEDETSYTVTYEVERTDKSEEPRTSASTTHSSKSATVKENIVLDLSALEGSQPVRITVRITDHTSGEAIERSSLLHLNSRSQSCSSSLQVSEQVN